MSESICLMDPVIRRWTTACPYHETTKHLLVEICRSIPKKLSSSTCDEYEVYLATYEAFCTSEERHILLLLASIPADPGPIMALHLLRGGPPPPSMLVCR